MNLNEFSLKTADHQAIENPILARISSAESDIAGFNSRLTNDLHPQREQLEGQIANDNALIANTTSEKIRETAERNT